MSREPKLTWTSFPFIERPLISLLLTCFLTLLGTILWYITVIEWKAPFFFFAGMIMVIANLMPYFIITRYEIFDNEVQVTYLFLKISRKFADFGCFYKDKRGIMLSTFKVPRRLDVFRGQSLRFSKKGEEIEQLMQILIEKIPKKY
ncbi:MAG: hypothetical protein FJ042_05260 [Candidatus Cloacimonetes bacterium]|nr:hypothetical protein [Candidatus Cloacimonadota bacterium]